MLADFPVPEEIIAITGKIFRNNKFLPHIEVRLRQVALR